MGWSRLSTNADMRSVGPSFPDITGLPTGVEDVRQEIVYKFREDSYQGKMWFRICMFSASKVYSKDRDANDYRALFK